MPACPQPSEQEKAFAEPTVRRLPVYHNYIKKAIEAGALHISCTQIAHDLNLNPIKVRKDLESTGLEGKPKVGYETSLLASAIESFLGWHNKYQAIIVGAGHLGSALMGYQGFGEYGLRIVAAFDADPAKAGTLVHGKKVHALDKLEPFVQKNNIQIGILTVPGPVAQALADRMVRAGIAALWNFAPARITVPAGAVVQHENLASSLAVLSKKIDQAKEASRG